MADTIIYALLGGILPALVWLLFWLREDNKNPEPRNLIGRTFLLGMLTVLLVLPFQKGVEILFPSLLVSIFLWAVLEEAFKFAAGYFGGLHSVEDNEPLDPLVYMITAALGFVAMENTLFILGPILGGNLPQAIITGNMRFVGASLLHVVASGIVGVSLSFSFYRSRAEKLIRGGSALLIAIIFHSIFNFLILGWGETGANIAFLSVWIGVILLLLAFEKAKTIAPRIE